MRDIPFVDRRRAPRFEVIGDLRAAVSSIIHAPVLNISADGLLFQSFRRSNPGSFQRIHLKLNDRPGVVVDAVVKHTRVASNHGHLVGVAFVGLPSRVRQEIVTLVEDVCAIESAGAAR